MKRIFTTFLCCAFALFAFGQNGSISGTVTDSETLEAVFGATVLVNGTSQGTVTDFDGAFTISDVPVGAQTVTISYIGFQDVTVDVQVREAQDANIGTVEFKPSAIGLSEVKVIASVATSRKTPVAISTIKAKEIEAKIGSQEFPEILKSTPGVYATKAGGGFGDGRINVRGFSSENVAVLINGVPVNDMENGRVFWSNWAGLNDAAALTQVQRGLGASKVAVPSIGGTINIISKASDYEKGGFVYAGVGNNNYGKLGLSLSSGLTDNGWAFTATGSKTTGDGYVDGTPFSSFAYYANISKKFNDDHEMTLTAVGAKQRHGQRQNPSRLATYEESGRDIRYNPDWGYKAGEAVSIEDNFYHKPQISLNHYWTIGTSSRLSTSAYASFGTGGGGGTAGAEAQKFTNPDYRVDGVVDLDRIVDENLAVKDFGSDAILRASRNDHKWYGILSSFTQDVTENFSLLAGLDLRYYRGSHFREVTDLLGGDYFLDDDNINNPVNAATVGDKWDYNNDGIVNWVGGFLQGEYEKDKLAAFATLNISNTGYSRIDYFNNYDDDTQNAAAGLANQRVGAFNFLGYGLKGGANYNLTDKHNIFVNIGYFEKAPGFDAVFPRFNNEIINADAENQKIFSSELGYGLRTSTLTANVNLYNTQWVDRTFTRRFTGAGGEELIANILGVNAVHSGIELDAVWRPNSKLKITGMASLGDWVWANDLVDLEVFDGDSLITTVNAFIKDLHVGDAAQTTAALGLSYKLLPGLKLGVDYNYYDRLFASYDPISRDSRETAGIESWQVPDWGTFDLNVTYDFKMSGFNASLYGNVYNLTNEKYVADARDGADNNAQTATVFYGYGINWNMGLKLRF